MVTFQGVYEVFTPVTYESKANLTNFVSSWENDEFVCFHTQNEDKSQNIARGTTDPEIDSVNWIKFSTCISCKFAIR